MKKSQKSYILCWAILLALFNVLCFATPAEWYGFNKFGGAFWAGYLCITAAFAGQLVCALIAIRSENAQKLFYRLPLLTVSYTGLILTLVFGGLCMAIPDLPNWAGIVVCAVVLAFTAVAVIKASAAAELVQETDEKVKARTQFVRHMTAEAEAVMNRAKSAEAKAACKTVREALRYSDPISGEALSDAEAKIAAQMDALKAAVAADDAGAIASAAEETVLLIKERNALCRAMK